jgi:hypothetical protein
MKRETYLAIRMALSANDERRATMKYASQMTIHEFSPAVCCEMLTLKRLPTPFLRLSTIFICKSAVESLLQNRR